MKIVQEEPHTYQAIQLRDGVLVSRLGDVPRLDATLAAGVDVLGGVRDRYGAYHFAVVEGANLAGVPRNPRSYQGVLRKGHRLHLALGVHVKGIGTAKGNRGRLES